MMIRRIIAPVKTLGPGERVCVWTQGCSKHCVGCISPELQPFIQQSNLSVEMICDLILQESQKSNCKQLTISGGDPFEQTEELTELLGKLRNHFEDILVYTGFTFEQIECSESMKKCLKYIDVLIDGRYIEELNDNETALRGSTNQNIIFINPNLKSTYEDYMRKGRFVKCYYSGGNAVAVGIPTRKE